MTTTNPADALRDKLPSLFECFPAEVEGVQVRTPLLFPDGDVVDVFVLERNGGYLVTDYGDGLGWFRSQSIEERLSLERRRRVKELCASLGVELDQGQLLLNCDNDGLSAAVQRLAQAVIQVAELLSPAQSDNC